MGKMTKRKKKKRFPIGIKKQTNNNNKKEETNKSNKNYSHPIGWLLSFSNVFLTKFRLALKNATAILK